MAAYGEFGLAAVILRLDPIPQRRRVDVQQLAHVPARGQLGLAAITQPVLVETHRASTGLLVELPGSGHGSSLVARSGGYPRPRAVHFPRPLSAASAAA